MSNKLGHSMDKWAELAVLFSWQLQNGPPGILMFSMSMGTDYSFELIFIKTYAPQFIGHNKFFLGSVFSFYFQLKTCTL